MSTVPAQVHGPSDAELIESVRGGTVSAYGELYERHVSAARNLARQLARGPAEVDDLVSEAFAKVLDTLRQGRGPDSAFRAYLLTALRHTAYDKTRRDRKLELSDDVTQVSGVNPESVSVPFSDTAVAGLERTLAARAFALLPERWQAVLWHTEIEGQSPAEVAPLLGLSPNGVSALAYRAREGLRQAYLKVHIADSTEQRCKATAERLGAWVRGGLSKREKAQVEAHLDECERCRALAAELADINTSIGAVIPFLVLGSGTGGYLIAAKAAAGTLVGATAAGAGAAVVGAGVVAGTTTGAAAGAGAAASAPRQLLGVAASGVALAAAIAVGLAAAPSGQQIPAAAQPPQVAAPTQPAPKPAQPAPAQPIPEPPAPKPAPPTAPPPPTQQPVQPPQLPPPPIPTPTPGPPNLSANGPAIPVSLVPGGQADLPLTIRNTGGSLSQPVAAVLNLPAGVIAIASGPIRFSGDHLLRLNGQLTQGQSGTVYCPGGTGTVRCGTEQGLQPGEAVTLLFRLRAQPDATSGEVTGSVTAGASIAVRISVQVTVTPPPTVDKVDVRAKIWTDWFDQLWPWHHRSTLDVTARNTGTSTKPITVTAANGGALTTSSVPVTCEEGKQSVTCTTVAPVAPNTAVQLQIRLRRGVDVEIEPTHHKPRSITVTAVLGSASATTSVQLPWSGWWPGLLPHLIGHTNTGLAPTTTPPSTSTTRPTTTAPPTTAQKPPTAPEPPARTTAPKPPPTMTPPPETGPPGSTEPGEQPQPLPSCTTGKGPSKRWNLPC